MLAAIVGVIASLAAWCFLELIFYIQRWVFTDIPHDVGYDNGAPLWWYLPVLRWPVWSPPSPSLGCPATEAMSPPRA